MSDIITDTKPAKRGRRMARDPKQTTMQDATAAAHGHHQVATAVKPASKVSLVFQLLQRDEGATLSQLVAATGWLPHSTRAALTGLKKKGHEVTSSKADGEERVYRVVAS